MDLEWKAKIEARLVAVETKAAVDEVHRTNTINRLVSIEDTLKWLVRLVVGGIVMAVVAFIVSGGFTL